MTDFRTLFPELNAQQRKQLIRLIEECLPERQPLQDPELEKFISRSQYKTYQNGDIAPMTEDEKRAHTAISPLIYRQEGFNKALDEVRTHLNKLINGDK